MYDNERVSVSQINTMIDSERTEFFNFTYPTGEMTAEEKASFERHFLQHYLYNEIGFETVGMFKNRLCSKLWDIMPYYTELYKTLHFELDYFNDYSIHTINHNENTQASDNTQTGKIKNTTSSESENSNTGNVINLQSDTPQGNVNINSNDYVSAIGKSINDLNNSNTATSESEQSFENYHNRVDGSNVGDSETTTHGNNGQNLEKLKKYRESILNIEMMIIKDCYDLFMQIW